MRVSLHHCCMYLAGEFITPMLYPTVWGKNLLLRSSQLLIMINLPGIAVPIVIANVVIVNKKPHFGVWNYWKKYIFSNTLSFENPQSLLIFSFSILIDLDLLITICVSPLSTIFLYTIWAHTHLNWSGFFFDKLMCNHREFKAVFILTYRLWSRIYLKNAYAIRFYFINCTWTTTKQKFINNTCSRELNFFSFFQTISNRWQRLFKFR